jgi:RNA polymerase sporulation-specific sigma factor
LLVLVAAALRGVWLLHGSLGNASAFPQPLSADEEREAIAAMRAGDVAARNRLIEHNLRLVAHIVKKFEGCGEDTEDLISIGTVGLIKGVGTFRPDRGTRLATYAARCIENDMLIASPCTMGVKCANSTWL